MKKNSLIRALPYPALEAGNLSFSEGDYEVDAVTGKSNYSVEITHKISGVPFFEKLINDGVAKFGCFLSISKAGIRRLDLSDTDKQIVEWSRDILGETPKLLPVLLYTGDEKEYTLTKEDGVAKIWQGKKISLPKGARLARYNYLNVNSSEYGILRFKQEEKHPKGSFTVEANTEEGFYFNVKVAPDIFHFVQASGGKDKLRQAILTNAVARCFEILKNDYKETEDTNIEAYGNLKDLSAKLVDECDYDWNDERFDPSGIATQLYPIRIPDASDGEEDE